MAGSRSSEPTSRFPYRMGPLELATGLVLGEDHQAPDDPLDAELTPVMALERSVLPCVARPPCIVSFSGGRDSSVVLAIATRVARREGLPPPIPVTCRVPDVPEMEESAWQELVVRHMGLDNWERLEFTTELDCIGPFARAVLERHGLIWPFNAHLHVPVVRAAAGGSVLTGAGGDELLSPPGRAETIRVLSGRRRPEPRDLLRIGLIASPPMIRRRVMLRRYPGDFRWLRRSAETEFARAWTAEAASEPSRWNRSRRWWRRRRYVRLMNEALELIGADEDVWVHSPFTDPVVVDSIARFGGPAGFATRTDALRAMMGELLPDELLARTSKATGNLVFFSDHARRFAEGWDGTGVDLSTVDAAALHQEWSSSEPDPHTLSLLQAAWLYATGASAPPVSP